MPLLSLDEDMVALRIQLAIVADHLIDATLVGNPAPKVAQMHDRLFHPRVGDWVYECSRALYTDDPSVQAKGIGILRRIEQEPVWTREELQEEADLVANEIDPVDLTATQKVWYIQYGPNEDDVCRWTNAEFHVIPMTRHPW